jgi:hypothetical protein
MQNQLSYRSVNLQDKWVHELCGNSAPQPMEALTQEHLIGLQEFMSN